MDELTIIRLALKCLPTLLVVVLLLELLTEEYLRLMELAGLVRRRSSTGTGGDSDVEEDGTDRT